MLGGDFFASFLNLLPAMSMRQDDTCLSFLILRGGGGSVTLNKFDGKRTSKPLLSVPIWVAIGTFKHKKTFLTNLTFRCFIFFLNSSRFYFLENVSSTYQITKCVYHNIIYWIYNVYRAIDLFGDILSIFCFNTKFGKPTKCCRFICGKISFCERGEGRFVNGEGGGDMVLCGRGLHWYNTNDPLWLT